MTTIKQASQKGTEAVKRLREQKLRSGRPFMINVQEMAAGQCYLEYPGGAIELVAAPHSSGDLAVIRQLTPTEANRLRRRFHFSVIG